MHSSQTGLQFAYPAGIILWCFYVPPDRLCIGTAGLALAVCVAVCELL